MSQYKDFDFTNNQLYNQIKNIKSKNNFFLPEVQAIKKTTRIDWINVNIFLKTINRNIQHLILFLKNDRRMTVSFTNNVLMIQGKFNKTDIEKIMIEYSKKYCQCKVCLNFNTSLLKDSQYKKYKLSCNTCKSTLFI